MHRDYHPPTAASVCGGGSAWVGSSARGSKEGGFPRGGLPEGGARHGGLWRSFHDSPAKEYGDSSAIGCDRSVLLCTLQTPCALLHVGSCPHGAQVRSSVSTTAFSSTVDQAAGRLEGLWGLWRQGTKVCE